MSLSKQDFRTFNEWSKDGYQILKGSKATWIDGVPMFSRQQVREMPLRDMFPEDADYTEDDYTEHWDWGIDPGMMVSD